MWAWQVSYSTPKLGLLRLTRTSSTSARISLGLLIGKPGSNSQAIRMPLDAAILAHRSNALTARSNAFSLVTWPCCTTVIGSTVSRRMQSMPRSSAKSTFLAKAAMNGPESSCVSSFWLHRSAASAENFSPWSATSLRNFARDSRVG